MNRLEQDDYLALRAGATILEEDGFGEKVLRLADGTMLKLFRRKRLLSSAAWSPYAQRFADNAAALHQRHIPAPVIIAVWRVPSIDRDAVHYHPLVGKTLREMRREGLEAHREQALKAAFTRFVIHLHDCGVYFRSLHLGNVVYTPDHQFGLIDISDARMGRRALSKQLRARNLRRLEGIPEESEWVDSSAVLSGALQEKPRTL
ncbi:toluene tolerance protein [Accumulibacter sp.]|uniref:toluene tolerance protein n=1 Tax=Accumulibacter sp. TaxID=2053492 RepID=UPI0028C4863B|nr:toluene tolerance protein [Accumulibacter sp.]